MLCQSCLFCRNRLISGDIGNNTVIPIVTRTAMLAQLCPHVAGTFATLRLAAMKTENLRRARGIALRCCTFYIALIKGITNTNKHKCKCNQLLVTHDFNSANANRFQTFSYEFHVS
ncbi:hypothetical protein THS27_05885 [Thalassospira sp. MCCC 1A01428]|nr:hypothetical protein THS27_05885 [Thalassospira sp. MCCC 1A01428]